MRALSNIKHRFRVSDDARYLAIGQVRERFGVSDMWVWRYMRDHGFPKPVQFGGPTSARHWRLSDIESWELERANKTARRDCQLLRSRGAAQRRAIMPDIGGYYDQDQK